MARSPRLASQWRDRLRGCGIDACVSMVRQGQCFVNELKKRLQSQPIKKSRRSDPLDAKNSAVGKLHLARSEPLGHGLRVTGLLRLFERGLDLLHQPSRSLGVIVELCRYEVIGYFLG